MSELRSVLDQLAAVATEDLTIEELAADISEFSHASQVFEVLVAQRTKEISKRHGHVELGYSSPTTLLMDQARMSAGHAKQVVSRANASDSAPVAFAAWADGRLSTDQTRHLFQLAEAVPDVFPAAEERLVEIIEPLTVNETAKVLEYWRQSVDGPGELDPDSQLVRRGVSLSQDHGRDETGRRMAHRHCRCGPGNGARRLQAAASARRLSHPTSATSRRPGGPGPAWLDHGDTPVVGGEKPHISVIADIPALQGIAGGLHETLNGDILDVDTLRMLACDCSVSRIVFGPDSEVLDIGRKTRVWTSAQRRAIIARDSHCQGEGCEVRPEWCDIHHLEHWADGGRTSLDNGTLLCRSHHTLEHREEGRSIRLRN